MYSFTPDWLHPMLLFFSQATPIGRALLTEPSYAGMCTSPSPSIFLSHDSCNMLMASVWMGWPVYYLGHHAN